MAARWSGCTTPWERDGAKRIVLETLTDQAVAEVTADLLGATPEPDLLALAAEAGGVPLVLLELLGGLRDEGAIDVADGRARLLSRRVPQRMQDVTRNRLGRLSSRARHSLQVAAVLGRSFRVDELADMLREPPSRLLPALEEAEGLGVLEPAGEMLRFRHDLLWRAVTETVAMPVRQALHRQAGEMLLERGGSVMPAAAHLMKYARPGDATALAGLDRAVHEVLASSPQTAADLAVRALELTPTSDPHRFDRTVTAVYALTTAGRPSEAADLAHAGLGLATRAGQTAHLRYELANALLSAGRTAEGLAEAETALAQEDLSDDLRDLAEHVRFRGLFVSDVSVWRGRGRAEEVVAAEGHHSDPTVAGAHLLLTTIAWREGRAADGIGHVREAVRIAGRGQVRAQHLHPRLHLATLLTDMRRFDEAETALRIAKEEITAMGHTVHAASPAILRARLRLAAGGLDDAATEAQAGLAIADEIGVRGFVLLGNAVQIIVALRRGDLDGAVKHADHHRVQLRARQAGAYGHRWADWAMALVVDAQSGPGAALRLFKTFCTDRTELTWLLMADPDVAAWLTRTALADADRSYAETVATLAARLAHDNPDFPTLAASAAHARGILHDEGTALAHAAATHGGPWSRASAAEDLGVLLARTAGDSSREAAIRSMDQALDGYQRMGALRDAARIRARLRRLGVRRRHWTPAERPVSGWASLTDTERNVAALVAQGLTNPQVAAQMFITPHTVKFHLRQVFRKLGIGSRVELARLSPGRPQTTFAQTTPAQTTPTRTTPPAAGRGGPGS